MILDSQEQKEMLQQIVESTNFNVRASELAELATRVQALRIAVNNAEIAEAPILEAVGD